MERDKWFEEWVIGKGADQEHIEMAPKSSTES